MSCQRSSISQVTGNEVCRSQGTTFPGPNMVEPGWPTCPYCQYKFLSGKITTTYCPSCNNKVIAGHEYKRSCGNQYTGANNVYYKDGCPAIMDDGRFVTYYNSTNELTETMRKMNGFRSTNQFRTFMQNNADLFMDAERAFQDKKYGCKPHTACSEGWYDLWSKYDGYWAHDVGSNYSLNN